MTNLLNQITEGFNTVASLIYLPLRIEEISDLKSKLIYVVNTDGEILSIRDFRGNILDINRQYIDAVESDAYKRWKARFDSELNQ